MAADVDPAYDSVLLTANADPDDDSALLAAALIADVNQADDATGSQQTLGKPTKTAAAKRREKRERAHQRELELMRAQMGEQASHAQQTQRPQQQQPVYQPPRRPPHRPPQEYAHPAYQSPPWNGSGQRDRPRQSQRPLTHRRHAASGPTSASAPYGAYTQPYYTHPMDHMDNQRRTLYANQYSQQMAPSSEHQYQPTPMQFGHARHEWD